MPASDLFAQLRRTPAVLLALLIALLGAAAPTLSHALGTVRGGTAAVEVCTSNGTRWVTLERSSGAVNSAALSGPGQPDSSGGSDSSTDFTHCPFCLLSMDRAAPAPRPWVHLFVALGDAPLPTVFQDHFYALSYSLGPPARGPPPRA